MNPIVTVLEVGGVDRPIGGYGVMLALAMLVGGLFAARAAGRAGMDVGNVIAAAGFVVAGSLTGGFVAWVLVEGVRTGEWMRAITQPGLVFYGSPVGGMLALWAVKGPLEIDLGRLADVAIPSVPLAHATGRLGCFLGGCCFGKPFDGWWAVRYVHPLAPGAHPSVFRHPSPLYEAAGLLFLAAVLILRPPDDVGSGARALGYVMAYALLRFGLELLRGDRFRGLFFGDLLSTSQLVSIVLFVGAGLALLHLSFRGRTPREALS